MSSEIDLDLCSMEPTIDNVNCENLPTGEGDAGDFLLSNSKYHDCFFTVGNPKKEEVERIGVASLYLIANSLVFRKAFENRRQGDPPLQFYVSFSPATFKLMLRSIYGGKLPKMTPNETLKLALCANTFKVPRLVQETTKCLVPSGADDVYSALIAISYGMFPDLEVKVTKIIQQNTRKVVQNITFLMLSEKCLLFILKQNTLNIDEVELWRHVVRWAEYQVVINATKTVRDYLVNILGYVRFLTFTIEEVLEHVLPKKILTSDEYMDLSLALTKKQALESPVLCKITDRRNVYKEVIAAPSADNIWSVPSAAVNGAKRKTKDEMSLAERLQKMNKSKRKRREKRNNADPCVAIRAFLEDRDLSHRKKVKFCNKMIPNDPSWSFTKELSRRMSNEELVTAVAKGFVTDTSRLRFFKTQTCEEPETLQDLLLNGVEKVYYQLLPKREGECA